MGQDDPTGRERLIEGYLPMVAGRVKRLPKHMQTLGMILYCMHELEKAVDGFNFLQDREPFVHRLSWSMRQAVTKYIVK